MEVEPTINNNSNSNTQINKTSSSNNNNNNNNNSLSVLDERIVYCQLSLVAKKDFNEEVRALLDVRKFVVDSFILLDFDEIRIGAIVKQIVDRLVECRNLGDQVAEEAKSLLFVERNSLSMVLANTMQGLYKSRSDGRLAYDHSWMVATCSLSSLQKRQVAIARFKQPVNFGRQSQEVRFLIIVLAPSKEKLTKSAWETGRTFATMFTDIEFRRRLLRAKNQDEIKVELLVRAETLAREGEQLAAAADEEVLSERDSTFYSLYASQHQLNQQSTLRQLDLSNNSSSITMEDKKLLPHLWNHQHHHLEPHLHYQQHLKERFRMSAGNITLDSMLAGHQACPMECCKKQQKLALISYNNDHIPNHPNYSHHSHQQTSFASSTGSSAAGSGGGGQAPSKVPMHRRKSGASLKSRNSTLREFELGHFGSGLLDDLRRRTGFYLSDFTDGFLGDRSLYKTISTTIFLYFSVLLPCIAFGVVDTNNTDGAIDPKKTMIGQALGGCFFALFSGQPLVVIMTTAPLCIYVKVIYQISQDLEVDFGSFYACVGLWMCLFLVLMALTNSSNLMKYCTRSTEDIFALFTAFAFGSDGVKEAIRSFQKYYYEADCNVGNLPPASSAAAAASLVMSSASSSAVVHSSTSGAAAMPHASLQPELLALANQTLMTSSTTTTTSGQPQHNDLTAIHVDHHASGGSLLDNFAAHHRCQRETCILFLFLMSGTLWLANSFNAFDRTPYLSSRKREIIKDYALAFAVLIFSFIGSYLFQDIRLDVFEFGDFTGLHFILQWSPQLFNPRVMGTTALLGFMLAVLFYIDQNICGAMVNNAPYKLKKGDYFHLDLIILALINALLSLTGLPWMHGKLPHSHLHSKALADYEERVDEGHIHQIIVNIRETRLTGLLVSLLVALSLLAVPYPLSYIPLPVLSGVFLYTALAEFKSNSMVERICLLFTEQAAYPPNHYIRRCPQRKIHFFTMAQIVQLAIVSFVGFYPNPYVNMAFPLVVATFVPLREVLLPRLIDSKYLNSLDSASLE